MAPARPLSTPSDFKLMHYPFVHVLGSHDLKHGLVVKVTGDEGDLVIVVVFLSERRQTMMPIGNLGPAIDGAGDDVVPEASRLYRGPKLRDLIGVDGIVVDVPKGIRSNVLELERGQAGDTTGRAGLRLAASAGLGGCRSGHVP